MSSEKLKFEDRKDLVRDSYSGAILNTDLSAVIAYKARKQEINKMRELELKVSEMNTDIKDIKKLLLTMSEGKNKK